MHGVASAPRNPSVKSGDLEAAVFFLEIGGSNSLMGHMGALFFFFPG